ncbi:CHASE3 domain-containing protein, partial [Acidisphaera sp. L21]|uniref:CHASE3 domain-containing protein n=1 Tax=Acidisphaera sp. L21 TaxID=1641851 RepID=UPI0015750D81
MAFSVDRWDRGHFEAEARRDNQMILVSERLLSSLKDIETAQRGFLLTGDESYLGPYNEALPLLHGALDTLAGLGWALDGLPALVDERVALIQTGIRARRADGLQGAVAMTSFGRGKQTMDTIRVRIGNMEAAAQTRIDKTSRRARQHTLILTSLCLLALAGAIATVGVYSTRRRRETRLYERRTRESVARFRALV